MKEIKATVFNRAGKVTAEALVGKKPISCMGGVNTEFGTIIDEEHDLFGECFAGKVLVYPFGKGSTGDCLRIFRACLNGVGPAAIVNTSADPIHTEGALLAGIPFLSNFEDRQDPVELIKTGDTVTVCDGVLTIE